MRLYHRTYHHEAIMERGFRDGAGTYMTGDTHRGVWVSDRPLDRNEGAYGDVILVIKAPESEIVPFEWVEEDKTYREFLVPADTLNRLHVVELVFDWMPEDDRLRRGFGLPERRPGW